MCGAHSPISSAKPIGYLALGDSYTIGTGASHEARNFPSLIAARIEGATHRHVELINPAVNGFTTVDLIAKELGYITDLKPDLVSILIGVNDLVQGRGLEQYRGSLVEIYDAIPRKAKTAAISIPNWSLMPAAREFGDPARLQSQTEKFNEVAQREATARGFTWIDLTEVSSRASKPSSWIASDNLHPGDDQYAAWADVIWDVLKDEWTKP